MHIGKYMLLLNEARFFRTPWALSRNFGQIKKDTFLGILFYLSEAPGRAHGVRIICKRQMIHTFTPSNQRVKVVAGGDVYETYTRRMERTDR